MQKNRTFSDVVKFPIGSCSLYENCSSCLSTEDPLGCGWCGDHCAHVLECETPDSLSTNSCSPLLYEVSPSSGPTEGGTLITLRGDNFGSSHSGELQSKISVSVAGAPCLIHLWHKDRVQCKTSAVTSELSGFVQINVTDMSWSHGPFDQKGSAQSDAVFSYVRFVEWAQNEIAVVPDFHKRILFSDEAHFWLNGYVNKHNCRIWSEANPQVYVETPLHPEKLTVWCALWAGGIIGPYFFKNDEGHNVTVNGDRYRAMITNFFFPELNNHDVQELWFQQDGATCHTAPATIDLLKDTFGDRLISRFGPVNWPPRSCDLTPLDYFLWGYVKSLVYADKPQTLDHLEDNIRRVIADIRPQMLEKVIENWTSRLDYIRASRGSPMPEIIFKM
ncbi:putative transposable element [Trichonephila clavipes]|nr:putative transposable element [Trichonephila clavipes]